MNTTMNVGFFVLKILLMFIVAMCIFHTIPNLWAGFIVAFPACFFLGIGVDLVKIIQTHRFYTIDRKAKIYIKNTKKTLDES